MKQTLLLFLTLLLAGTAMAQSNDSLVVFYISDPGTRPSAIFSDGFESGNTSRWDFNGDGTPDLFMTREDEQGNIEDLLILNAASLDTLWRVIDVPGTLGISATMNLWGFADADADGTREALFFDPQDVILIDPRSNTHNWALEPEQNELPIRLMGASDVTEDGFEEVFVILRGTRQVQVWTARQ